MDKQSSPKSSLFDGWNAPPNLVTYSRIVLVVFFLTLDILAGAWGENNLTMRWVAAVLFIIAASTDKIDGWMARKYNQVTEMGKLMDPIADKLLTCGAMIVCSAFGELGWWVTILFLIREIGITVMRFFVMERPGGKVIAAAWPGKLKTVFQCVGLSMLLLPFWSLGNGQATPFWMTAYYFLTYAIIYVHWSCASTRVRVPVQHVRRPEAEVTDIPMRELCDSLAAGILKICEANNTKIACAESLTGGLLADAFVRIPGAPTCCWAPLSLTTSMPRPRSCTWTRPYWIEKVPYTPKSPGRWPSVPLAYTASRNTATESSAFPPPAWPAPVRTVTSRPDWCMWACASPQASPRTMRSAQSRRTPS